MAADLYLGSLPSLKEHLILDALLPELLRFLPGATTRIICSDPLITINLFGFLEGVSSYSLYILLHVLETHVHRPLSRQLRHDVDLPISFLSVSLSLYSSFNYQIIHAWLFQQPNHPRLAFSTTKSSTFGFFNNQIFHVWLFQQPNHPRLAFSTTKLTCSTLLSEKYLATFWLILFF